MDTKMKPLGMARDDAEKLFEHRDGVLYWRSGNGKSVKAGDVAGSGGTNGYWRIKIDGRIYKRSRLIWLIVSGADNYPLFLDHVNRVRDDDRVENLKLATHGENQSNRAWGVSKHRYVYREGGRWRARLGMSTGRANIGSFKTEQEAIDAVNRHGAACV